MPEWIVEGAEKATGVDQRIRVSAPSKEAAFHEAAALGLVVASVEPMTDSDLAAAATAALQYHRPIAPGLVQDYPEIPAAARWLQVWVTIIGIVGGIVLLLGLLLAGVSAFGIVTAGLRQEASANIYRGIGGIVTGSFILGVAATMNMIAKCGWAIRDIARNSHR